ncbi:MAG: hypothetical protein ACI9JM_001714 [Halioglobus sp.]|jgi:hypothetical protein
MKRKTVFVSIGLVALLVAAGFALVSRISSQMFPPQSAVSLIGKTECALDSFDSLPDSVRLLLATQKSIPASHCKIDGVIDTEIHFELLLPDNWNGKFVMGGGGGFVGAIANMAVFYGALQSGYATVGTDTGHAAHSRDASWALDNPQRIENFGHRAVHQTAVVAKALLRSHYGRASARNYFLGCSRGGGQALMEAQRYPADFDGIVAGAPAYNWTIGIGANATQINRAMFPDPEQLDEAVIRPQDQALISAAYLAQCDSLDGIEDGILADPRDCPFDIQTLLCADSSATQCLTKQQINAMQVIYEGPSNDAGALFPGFPLGGEISEQGMGQWLTGGLKHISVEDGETDADGHRVPLTPNFSFGFGNGIMKYLIFNDAQWDYSRYDYNQIYPDTREAESILNATDPNLDTFRKGGGKLLMYHGWSDRALSALATIDYYDQVLQHDAAAEQDVKLYLLPGVDHCFGGQGPSLINYLTAIDHWVESGEQPGPLQAQWLQWDFLPSGSRLVCPYPQKSVYSGIGDTREASSFSCSND